MGTEFRELCDKLGIDFEPKDAFTIREFCKRHNISPAFFHLLQKDGRGPRVMRIGARTLVSKEAAADWRRDREAAAKAEREGEVV